MIPKLKILYNSERIPGTQCEPGTMPPSKTEPGDLVMASLEKAAFLAVKGEK